MNTSVIAKITRPKLSGIFGRDRLFHLLDQGRQKPIVWVAAQAGSGKTTLVASYIDSRKLHCLWYQVDQGDGDIASFFYYMGMAAKKAAPKYKKPLPLLTPEYLMGVPVFARRYFEELFRRLASPHSSRLTPHDFIIVLDNYQDAPLDSGFHGMLVNGLDVIPEGITFLVLSRTDPPPQFARLQANNRLQLIGWDDIRFTREESRGLLKTQGLGKPVLEAADLLHRKTEGWAAGLMLLLAGGTAFGSLASGQVSSASLFDYFANEIFDKTDPLTQHFLLVTAYLPRVTVPLAKHLTGVGEAGQILERLSSRHYFTQKYAHGETAYQYHPLFQEFLLARAMSCFDPAERLSIKRKAAVLLQSSGRNEDAAALLAGAEDWPALVRLILREAHTLIAQGRNKTLENWIKVVPEELRNNDAWLLYWLGVCRLTVSPPESRVHFERAFERFPGSGNPIGFYLSWCGVVDSYLYEWNNFAELPKWIDRLNERLKQGEAFPSTEIEAAVVSTMTGALFIGLPSHSDTGAWAERAYGILRLNAHPASSLQALVYTFNYFLWAGSITHAGRVVEEMAKMDRQSSSPLVRITFQQTKALFLNWAEGTTVASLNLVEEALEFGKRSGVHVWDNLLQAQGVYAALNESDLDSAENYLDHMKKAPGSDRGLGFCLANILEAWLDFLLGKMPAALHHSETALNSAQSIGVPFVAMLCRIQRARILFQAGETGKAVEQASRAAAEVENCRSRALEFMLYLTEAVFFFKSNDQQQGLDRLRQGLSIGRSENYLNMIFWWLPNDMADVCMKALEHDIEPEYVRRLITLRGLLPPEQADVNNWPYPIRIRVLGGFKITKNDQPLVFSAKVQKKPLELLKALIAFGGTDVSEEKISQELWPDADGDTAHRSFETTLYRLRKLVGEKILLFKNGQLTLNRHYCRVDAWEFEISVKRMEACHTPEAAQSMEKSFALYRGHFLPTDSEAEWSVPLRERLRDTFNRLVVKLGAYWEERSEWEKALEYFQKGVDVDELAEEFYQHAMICQIKLGRHAQAASTYSRCKAALARSMGIVPSHRTEELYESIRKNA